MLCAGATCSDSMIVSGRLGECNSGAALAHEKIEAPAMETAGITTETNQDRTAEDRRDCYWLYVVTCCKLPEGPKLMRIRDPAQLDWDEIRKIDHYALRVGELMNTTVVT